jgi:hypothetical protein
MPAEAAQPAQKQWCDAEGNHVALFSWVEQVAEHPEYRALFSQPHQRGEVVGRGPNLLYVRFEGAGGRLVSVPPQLVRVLPDGPGEHWCTPVLRTPANGDVSRQSTGQRSRV